MESKTGRAGSFSAAAKGGEVVRADAGSAIRLRVLVWPADDGRSWRAELRVAGATRPLCFERPLDLVVYLTALPGGASETRGLR
jgi:hypothetical protein